MPHTIDTMGLKSNVYMAANCEIRYCRSTDANLRPLLKRKILYVLTTIALLFVVSAGQRVKISIHPSIAARHPMES